MVLVFLGQYLNRCVGSCHRMIYNSHHCITIQVYVSQYYHHKVRLECVEYIGSHRDDFKEVLA